MKLAYQKRQTYLAGERRFVFILLGVILALGWALGALGGGQ